MNIKDIVDQEKQRALQVKVKNNQDKHIRKLFLKDCYKMWKDYKKVEKPYTWRLELFSLLKLVSCVEYVYWVVDYAPQEYTKDSWFDKKWSVVAISDLVVLPTYKIKLKTNPNDDYIYLS
jgi:hypothetical protein